MFPILVSLITGNQEIEIGTAAGLNQSIKQGIGAVLRNDNGEKKRQAAMWPSASILGAWGRG